MAEAGEVANFGQDARIGWLREIEEPRLPGVKAVGEQVPVRR
ncbi:MAG: hypothetical protein U0163_10450 [Gemmatimonadaceae bacterium]